MSCLSIHGCVECDAYDAWKCAACALGHRTNLGANVCECVKESGIVCPAGYVCVENSFCTASNACFEQNPHCLRCNPANPTLCEECADGTEFDPEYKLCLCGGWNCASNFVCTDAKCVYDKPCAAVAHCTACKSQNLYECAACGDGHQLTAYKECVCGAVACPSEQACITGVCSAGDCKVGRSAVKHCVQCDAQNAFQCAECGDQLHLKGNVCECRESHGSDCGLHASCVFEERQCYHELECLTRTPNCEMCAPEDTRLCSRCQTGFTLSESRNACHCGDSGVSCKTPFYCMAGQCVYQTCKTLTAHALQCGASNDRLVSQCTDGFQTNAGNSACICGEKSCLPTYYCDDGTCVDSCLSQANCIECSSVVPSRCLECASQYRINEYGACSCNDSVADCGNGQTCISGQCVDNCKAADANCYACNRYDERKCEVCKDSYHLDPKSLICVCGNGVVCSNDHSCINGACASNCMGISNCSACAESDPFKCAACANGTYLSYLQTACVCGSGSANCASGEQCIDGMCKCGSQQCTKAQVCVYSQCEDDCTTDVNCARCDAFDARKCVECAEGAVLKNGACSTGMSVGLIAGITVGTLLVVAAVVAVLFVVVKKCKRNGLVSDRANQYQPLDYQNF